MEKTNNDNCPMYKKHHNAIDGVYTHRYPDTWDEIPIIDEFDKLDEEGEIKRMLQDLVFYDIEDLKGFIDPPDNHGIKETIFVIRREGKYYLCETQGDPTIKFSTNITSLDFIRNLDRTTKLKKIQDNI